MADNNSKTFIVGIVIFVLLVIGGFAFFAKKDVPVDQTPAEVTAAPDAAAPAGIEGIELTPVPGPDAAPVPVPTPADEVTPTAPTPAYDVEVTPEAPVTEDAPVTDETPATEDAPAPAI